MLGDRLRRIRTEKGFTQEELAEVLHIGSRQIWRYENNETVPGADVVLEIARVLNVRTDFLLGLTEQSAPYTEDDLTGEEKIALEAWRLGDRLGAIRVIAASGK